MSKLKLYVQFKGGMEKTKKQRYQQQQRKSLKTLLNLQSQLVQFVRGSPMGNQALLNRRFPYIHGLQILRIFTLMQINFIICSFLDIIKKTNAIKVQEFKIGIIGGGVMGRLIINSLLALTKQGLKSQNILVSTRQPAHLQFYSDNFSVKTFFDNQIIAKEADFIFVATPATLDNWIIADLKQNLAKRLKLNPVHQVKNKSYANTIVLQNTQSAVKNNSVVTQKVRKNVNQTGHIDRASRKTIYPNKEPISLQPFVYILTSDFTEQKCSKIFSYPVLSPWLRATDISRIIERLKINLADKQPINNTEEMIRQLEVIMSEEIVPLNLMQQQSQETPICKSRIQKLIEVMRFSCKKVQQQWRKERYFFDDNNKNQTQDFKEPSKDELYTSTLKSQGSFSQTFLTKCRRWRMAYNNFIA